jgi:short-subunit dehydrogenase
MILNDRVAVVAGAGGAIGSALALKLKENGVRCIEVDKGFKYGCDFSDSAAVEDLVSKIKNEYPKIDFLFNVAGVGIYKNIDELTFKEWEDAYSINVHAPFLFTKLLLTSLKEVDGAMIFNVGSGMGVIGAVDRSSYCATKFALRGLSLSLSLELKPYNVDVVLLTLGSVMTPFGTGGIDKRRELERKGKKYLTVAEVVDKIIGITKSTTRDSEYTLYPEGYI